MRVLHLAAGNLYGGIETLLVTLARQRHLCPDMEPHFAICFEGRLSDELTAAGVAVHHLGQVRISRPWTVWRARRRLRALLRREKFGVLLFHGCWSHAIFAPVARASGVVLAYWSHDAPTGRHWLHRWAARHKPDLVLANSLWTQAAVPNLFPQVASRVLYCPLPAPELPEPRRIRAQMRATFQTADDATVILLASRLESIKGHAVLLEALGQLGDALNWVCWIAGGVQRPQEVSYLERIKAHAVEQDLGPRLHFLGPRTDVPQLLVAADVYCQPNTGPESFGLIFVEALYAGVPVLTTAIGGALEIVTDTCGLLLPPNDPSALAATLAQLIQTPSLRACLGQGGPDRARQLCDPERQIGTLGHLLRAAVKDGRN